MTPAAPITVVDWTTYDAATANFIGHPANGPRRDVGGIGGFFTRGMRWQDYLAHGTLAPEYAEPLRAAILERKLREPGEWHQNAEAATVPVFSDGAIATFSYRAWGDLMAAVWSEADGRDYGYMDFYMHVFMTDPEAEPEAQAVGSAPP